MGSKEFGNSYNVGGKDARTTGITSDNIGQYKRAKQEKERFAFFLIANLLKDTIFFISPVYLFPL